MADLIDRAALIAQIKLMQNRSSLGEVCTREISGIEIFGLIQEAPAVDAVVLPCKIGDRVWAIRSYKGIKRPQEGVVSEMFFTDDMRLMIVVKHVARGLWGETVFGSYKEAWNAIERGKTDATD